MHYERFMQQPHSRPALILSFSLVTRLLATMLVGCTAPAADPASRLLGKGTPGALSYGAASGATNAASLLRSCDTAAPADGRPPRPQTLDAACDQLRRSMHNQPGNAIPPV